MVQDIGNIIISKLNTLPFLDKYAGVVRVISYKDGTGATKRFPAECRITLSECLTGKRYLDLCPDDKKKSVMYLEDNGIRLLSREGDFYNFLAPMDLVLWLNLPLLGIEGCYFSGAAMLAIIKKLSLLPFNDGILNRVTINVGGQRPTSVNPFAKYTYDETVNQYLIFPYDYIVLPIETQFRLHKNCIDIDSLLPPTPCVKK